jgi:hypothetical protein
MDECRLCQILDNVISTLAQHSPASQACLSESDVLRLE